MRPPAATGPPDVGGHANAPLVILGGSGFVGTHLAADAVRSWGGPVIVIARREIQAGPDGVTFIRRTLFDTVALVREIPARAVFVNLAYGGRSTAEENLALADAVSALAEETHAARLVHVSTATVVGTVRTRLVTEETPCRPVTPYQRTKLAVESRIVTRAGAACPVIVVRPSAVFGPGGLNLVKLSQDLVGQPRAVNYLRACLFGRRSMHLVPVNTVVSAIGFAARSRQALTDRIYLVAADDAPGNNFLDVERIFREAIGLREYAVPVAVLPRVALAGVHALVGRRALAPDVRFDATRLSRAGFVPPVAFSAALRQYADALASAARAAHIRPSP